MGIMIERNKGHIVTIGSTSCFAPSLGMPDYHISKRGVLG